MKKVSFIGVIFSLVVSLLPASVSVASAQELTFDVMKTGVAHISVYSNTVEGDFEREAFGTGFFLNQDTLVTAAHVVIPEGMNRPSDYLSVNIEDDTIEGHGIGAFAKVVSFDTTYDLAVLKVTPMPYDLPELRENFYSHHSFTLAGSEPSVSDGLRIIGYPDITGGEISITSGIVSSKEQKNATVLFSDVQASFGNSGGPALNDQNEVIGLVSQIATSQSNNSQLTRIVSLVEKQDYLNQYLGAQPAQSEISSAFYNFMKELNETVILKNSETRTVSVTSAYYPDFSYTLPAGYSAGRTGRDYYILNPSEDAETVITTFPMPYNPDDKQLPGIASNLIGFDIDWDTLREDEVIAGLTGISFETKSGYDRWYVLDHDYSIILLNGSVNTESINSLSFSDQRSAKVSGSVLNNHNYDYQLTAPEEFVFMDGTRSKVYLYSPTSVYNYIGTFESKSDFTYAKRVENLKNYYLTEMVTEEFVVREHQDGKISNREFLLMEIYFPSNQSVSEIVVFEDPSNTGRYLEFQIWSLNADSKFPLVVDIYQNLTMENVQPTTFNVQSELDRQNAQDGISTTPSPTDTTTPDTTTSPSTDPGSAREDLLGYILLQVEQHGEAWYINPQTRKRIYMKDGKAAFTVMRTLGLGITNVDLSKFTIGTKASDSNTCNTFRSSLKGRVLLQVEENGEAWYIYPKNCRRYSLGRPDEAYEIMRTLGLGAITNDITIITEEAL